MTNSALKPLGDHLVKVATWNPLSEAINQEFNYVDLSAVDNQRKQITEWQTLVGKDAPSRARQIVRAGDVLVSTVRPNLNGVARIPKELDGATVSTGFCVLRADLRRLSPEYLFQWVRTPKFVATMVQQATGASYPAISDRIIFASKIPLPSLPEQRRIAIILDHADELRRKRQKALQLSDRLTQAVFSETFQGVAYESDALGNVADLKRGPFGGALKKEIFVEAGFKVYEQSHVIRKDYRIGRYFIDGNKYREMRAFSVLPSDLIISCSGTLGKAYLIPEDATPGIINQALLRVRVYRNRILPEYLLHFFESSNVQQVLSGFSHGTGLQNFPPMTEVRAIKVPLPPLDIQQRFVEQQNEIARVEARYRDHLSKLDTFFVSLQHRAFSGQLTSKQAERELARVG